MMVVLSCNGFGSPNCLNSSRRSEIHFISASSSGLTSRVLVPPILPFTSGGSFMTIAASSLVSGLTFATVPLKAMWKLIFPVIMASMSAVDSTTVLMRAFCSAFLRASSCACSMASRFIFMHSSMISGCHSSSIGVPSFQFLRA